MKMKKRSPLLLLVFATLQMQSATAQEPGRTLSLDLLKVRQMALAQNNNLLTRDLDAKIAEEEIHQTRQKRLPLLNTDVHVQRNLIIPTTPVPAKAFNPNAPEGEIMPLQFATRYGGQAGMELNYNLVDAAHKSEVRQARLRADIAKTDRELAETDAVYNASRIYAAALIAHEQLQLARADVTAKTAIHNMLAEQAEAGRITLNEFNNGKAGLNNALSRQKEAANILDKANADLLYELGIDPFPETRIRFEDDIDQLFSRFSVPEMHSSQSMSLQKLDQQNQLLQEEMVGIRVKNYPRVYLGGYLGSNFFSNAFDIYKTERWHGNSYVKLGVQVPLTGWFSFESQKKVLNYRLEANKLLEKNQLHQTALDYYKARKDAAFYEDKYKDKKANFHLQQSNYRLARQQFDEGRLLIGDLHETDFRMQQAKNEYLNAAYEYVLAMLEAENVMKK